MAPALLIENSVAKSLGAVGPSECFPLNSKNGISHEVKTLSDLWGTAGVNEVYGVENLVDVVNYAVGHWVSGFQNL
jgi:hypothetical protein